MNTIELIIAPISKQESEIAVAILSQYSVDNFLEEENCLKGYIAETDFRKEEIQTALQSIQLTFQTNTIPHQNWNAAWESNYEPIIVNDHVAIRAVFHEPIPSSAINIVIQPQMSFGTGHHATTRMMMEWISETECIGNKILDYGCGTGVLAIYAKVKGASEVWANDIETWCVENTIENFQLNDLPISEHIHITQKDIHELDTSNFDVILANINLFILCKQMHQMYAMLKKGSSVYMSGFFATDIPQICQAAEKEGFIYQEKKEIDGWASLKFTK
jgi:ribosomal protein L11 methyltransferase